MKNLLFLAVGLLMLSSCKDEGDLTIDILGVFDGKKIELNKSYEFGEIDLKFENLAFYITDLELINVNNDVVKLSDVEFIQLGGLRGQELFYENLPDGNYKRLRFNIGVTEDLNAKTPSDYDVTDALGRSDYYWEAWGSYIFSKTEGSADTDDDGVFELKWFYHTGSDALLREVVIEKDVVLKNSATSIIGLTLDFDKLLRNDDGSPFDIESNPRNHNPNDVEMITKLVDNYTEALQSDL